MNKQREVQWGTNSAQAKTSFYLLKMAQHVICVSRLISVFPFIQVKKNLTLLSEDDSRSFLAMISKI